MAKKNLIVGQSGGPTAVINSSLYGVVSEGLSHPDTIEHVYGMINGIEGFLNDCILDFEEALPGEDLNGLKSTPGAYLGSCRYKLPESLEDPVYPALFKKFEELNIGWFFYIGGNDSMDTVDKLNRYFCRIKKDVKVIGVPKTIDNDLVMTDHTPGFGSAAKYLAVTVDEIIRDTSIYAVKSVTIMEIMGRDSGWLTLAAALPKLLGGSKPDIVALPEVAFDENAFLEQINTLFQTTDNIVAVVSEGIRDQHGNYIGEDTKSGSTDIFGHQYLSGVGKYLEQLIHARIGCKVRSIEVNLMQRCAAHLASQTDLDEAEQIGRAAVKRALEGVSGEMMIFRRVSDHPYQIEIDSYPIGQIANKAAMVPDTMLDLDNSSCREKAADYLLPLIQGDVPQIKDENGMPKFFIL